jgi:hypothetical protein
MFYTLSLRISSRIEFKLPPPIAYAIASFSAYLSHSLTCASQHFLPDKLLHPLSHLCSKGAQTKSNASIFILPLSGLLPEKMSLITSFLY